MAELGGDEAEPDRPREVQLRQCTVLVGEKFTPDPEYPLGCYEFAAFGDEVPDTGTIAIIAVVEIDSRVVVAVPYTAWHRNLSRRRLPVNCLVKPVCISLPFEDRALEEGEEAPIITEKVWLGYLASGHEGQVVFDSSGAGPEPDLHFSSRSPATLPTAGGLAAAVEQHFAFVSAGSGADTPVPVGGAGDIDGRLLNLEAAIASLAENFQQLAPAPKPCRPTAKAVGTPPGLPQQAHPKASLRGLDAEVVQAARQSGVPEDHLQEMARLAGRGRPAMDDMPQTRGRAVGSKNPLSESEDDAAEEEEPAGVVGGGSGDPVEAALLKLTKITGYLAKKKPAVRGWEAMLDGSGAAGSGEGSLSSSRRHSAALRMLRRSLVNNPKSIFETVEASMSEDFQSVRQLPGSAAVPVTARAWLELRSRVQPYMQLQCGSSGASLLYLDCLRSGAPEEARARACLLLCQGDQLSIDRGSWVVASELALEDAPPMAAFNNHPLPSEAEPPYTKLIDPRWMELVLHRLNEYDQLTEKKKKLSRRPGPPTREEELKDGKGKGKKGKKQSGESGHETGSTPN